ncbi:hypothetical protein DBV14_06765 [Variovorax sp. KBW07]|uniref:hypothetical protein n=1 Tax=Variovorax sp. KBW07 TaxID=2153358 RepID=UPI000F57D393|nr:hypothetical protein [Variovorax sp. KBW07]RQO60141.1 hypothetical protein DBV14_06765 [Variovorax sp. KBW07]
MPNNDQDNHGNDGHNGHNRDDAHAPIDLAAHRERRARQQQEQQRQRQRASAAQASRDAGAATTEPGPGEVPCVRCKEPIYGHALRCPHCGVHFSGGAEAFAPKEGLPLRTKMAIALVALALLYAGLSDDIAAWW